MEESDEDSNLRSGCWGRGKSDDGYSALVSVDQDQNVPHPASLSKNLVA